ncbi:MAG: hypothetical protein EP338_12350 [Bacteroidetes bacterium]|nr:MAG: hypothetical protein EP338_12350 [Bacteroidota bacterium]
MSTKHQLLLSVLISQEQSDPYLSLPPLRTTFIETIGKELFSMTQLIQEHERYVSSWSGSVSSGPVAYEFYMPLKDDPFIDLTLNFDLKQGARDILLNLESVYPNTMIQLFDRNGEVLESREMEEIQDKLHLACCRKESYSLRLSDHYERLDRIRIKRSA